MGGRPKALLQLAGMTFLEQVVGTCREGGCADIWAVTRPRAREVIRLAFALDVQAVPNPDPERGMFSSAQRGLRAAIGDEPEYTGFVIFPVDHPRVRSRTVAQLIAVMNESPAMSWVQPGFKGRRGHPIGVTADGARALLDLDATLTLREALRSAGLIPRVVPVEDQHVLENVNTPADLE